MERTRSVEQRWSPRQSTVLDAFLHASGQRAFPGSILNISIGGLLVETSPGCLRLYGEVYVAFTDLSGEEPNHYSLPARTMWASDNHAGLMFSHTDASTVHLLREVLGRLPSKESVVVGEAGREAKPELPVSKLLRNPGQRVITQGVAQRVRREP